MSDELAKMKQTAIRFQVASERRHRDALRFLNKTEEYLKLVGTEEDMVEKITEWMQGQIDDLFAARMQVKDFMEKGIKDAVTIKVLRFGTD